MAKSEHSDDTLAREYLRDAVRQQGRPGIDPIDSLVTMSDDANVDTTARRLDRHLHRGRGPHRRDVGRRR